MPKKGEIYLHIPDGDIVKISGRARQESFEKWYPVEVLYSPTDEYIESINLAPDGNTEFFRKLSKKEALKIIYILKGRE